MSVSLLHLHPVGIPGRDGPRPVGLHLLPQHSAGSADHLESVIGCYTEHQ